MTDKEQINNSLKNQDKNFNKNSTHENDQIIINGIDVSKCEYLTNELEEDGEYYWFCSIAPAGGPDECEYNPECFCKKLFKQLKCKEQECKELKAYAQRQENQREEYYKGFLKKDKALDEIEEECNYAPMCDTEFAQRVSDIINKIKG